LAHTLDMGNGNNLKTDLAATFSQTTWDQEAGIKASDLLEEKGLVSTYFDQTSRLYMEQAVPRQKVSMGNTLNMGSLSVYLRNTYFGQTTEATSADIFDADLNLIDETINPYNEGKVITDLSLGYALNNNFKITVGANNLLDIYPDEVDPTFSSSGRFVYSRRSPQFSFGGRYLFARVSITLD
jgi:iron complex outermembrane receptor protein